MVIYYSSDITAILIKAPMYLPRSHQLSTLLKRKKINKQKSESEFIAAILEKFARKGLLNILLVQELWRWLHNFQWSKKK